MNLFMSKVEEIMAYDNMSVGYNELAEYIKVKVIKPEHIEEAFNKYKFVFTRRMLLLLTEYQTLNDEFMFENRELLYWPEVFKYQETTFETYNKDKEFFNNQRFVELFENDKIKMNNREKAKLELYFELK